MPYLAPETYGQISARMADTEAQELRNDLANQANQRNQMLRQIYQSGREPTVQEVGSVDPGAALDYQNNLSLQSQRETDNLIKKQNAVKGLATQMVTAAERLGFRRDDPSTYGVMEQLAPKFRPLFETFTGTKSQPGEVSVDHIIAMADMTPGEQIQQKAQYEREAYQQQTPFEVERARLEAEARANAEVGKQERIQPMEMELERYKSGLRTQQQIDETTGKAQAAAKVNLPKAIDQAKSAYTLLENLKNHPGLEASVGIPGPTGGLLGGKIIPGTEAANFNAKLKQIQGQAFLQAFEMLKGGGQITEVEGQKATQAIANLDTAQTEEQFKQAVSDLQAVLKRGVERSERAAVGDYSNDDAYTGSWGEPQIPQGAIVQESPSTGLKRFSTDGGNTWKVIK